MMSVFVKWRELLASVLACDAKIGPAGPILVPRTTFAAKIGLAGPILAAEIGPLPKLVPLDNFGPPSLLFPILHYRAIPLGTCIGSYNYS